MIPLKLVLAKPMSDCNSTKYPAEILYNAELLSKTFTSRSQMFNVNKQLFQNKVSGGRRTVQCPEKKAVATTTVQWQFHVVKTYECDTV